ncbi:MAG: replication initiator protein A [Bacteroidota bacterium]
MPTSLQKNLLADKHPVQDFFIADIFDSIPVKDDMASMEHPVFSLSKRKDTRNLEYKNGDFTITFKPNTDGLPTIFDKDVLLYCGSLMMKEMNKGKTPPRTLRVSSHDLLVATNRSTDGRSYSRLKNALDRLKGVSIKTNIKTKKREITSAFGLIESYTIVESSRVKKRMVKLEITLSEWFYHSILGKEVLTINRNYFRLGKALERRLYEIARKHCGKNSEWTIGLAKLKEKTGSTSHLDKFRFFIREITKTNHLPDYEIGFSQGDIVRFSPKSNFCSIEDLPTLRQESISKAKQMVAQSNTDWNFNAIHEQFCLQLSTGFKPDTVDGAFIGFVKKKLLEKA